jgi:hypothetical protein
MPIFELDEGRPILVQPMQPTPGSFTPDSAALVTDHLASLLGEQLFPVRARHGDAPGPHLLALDAAGQPVVVDMVQVLDSENLVRALQHAGVAGRLSRTELLRTYERGAEAFDADFQAFRDASPLTAAQAAPRTGARLLLVCADVDPQVADAIAFLRQPGRQVEVLQLGVVRGADGRRFVDVSPLVPNQPARRAVEPASLRLVRSTEALAEVMARDAERAASARVPYREPTPPESPAEELPAARTTASGDEVPGDPLRRYPAARTPAPAPAPALPAAAASAPTVRPWAAPVPVAGARPTEPTPSARVVPVSPPAPADYPWSPTASLLPGPRALPALAALVERGAVETLVWLRQRRGQRLIATLRPDGLIELPSGRVHADPDDAAADAANTEGSVDGWRAWRLGEGGPTLAEAAGTR